jgi:hypothetical protein
VSGVSSSYLKRHATTVRPADLGPAPLSSVLRTSYSVLRSLLPVTCNLSPISFLLLASVALAAPPQAVPVDGEPFPAQLVAVDAKWQLTFDSAGKPRILPAADLVAWGRCAEPGQGPILVLADGGLVSAEVLDVGKESLRADSDLLGTLKLPLDAVAGLLLRPPGDRAKRDQILDRLLQARGESDRLVLDNGDELSGLIETIQKDKARLSATAGPLEVETKRIVAVIFNPALRQEKDKPGRPAAALRAWVGLSDGSRLPATRLVVGKTSAQVTTSAGRTWKADSKEIVFLQPLGGRAVYVSDLKPAEYRHLPYLDLAWPYHADRNVTAGQLRAAGRPYLKGLGVHSAARLTYTLDQSYKRFQAELAIDDSTAGQGSVAFRVFVDGRQKFASGPVRGGDAPLPVSVDLSGAKRIDLVVDYGEGGDVMDHADWLDARVVK